MCKDEVSGLSKGRKGSLVFRTHTLYYLFTSDPVKGSHPYLPWLYPWLYDPDHLSSGWNQMLPVQYANDDCLRGDNADPIRSLLDPFEKTTKHSDNTVCDLKTFAYTSF